MKKLFMPTLFTAVVVYCFFQIYAEAQHPGPDYPDGPIDPVLPYIQMGQGPDWPWDDEPAGPYLPINLDIEKPEPPEGQCQIDIPITESITIESHCWEKPTVIKDNNGHALYFLISPGCVALVKHRTKLQIDVYQDKNCWVLLWDKTKLGKPNLNDEEAI